MRVRDKSSCLETDKGCYWPEQVAARRAALERVQKAVVGRYQSLLDPMAGTGSDALLLRADKSQCYVNDIDPQCRELLRQQFACVGDHDFFTREGRFNLELNPDLIFLDFNNWTQHKFAGRYGDCTRWAFQQAQKFVILNDTTFFYLRQYGRVARANVSQLLGTQLNSMEDYSDQLKNVGLCGWKATVIEQFYASSPKGNGGAAYVLFEKSENAS